MTMKLLSILNLYNNIKIMLDDTTVKIDVLLKFKLLGVLKSLEVYVQNFEIVRGEKFVEYGEKSENGNISIPTEKIEEFTLELQKLLDNEIEVNFKKIKASDIIDKGLNANYLICLYDIMEE